MKKLRVGFLLDNLSPSTYVNELIEFVDQEEIFANPFIITGYKKTVVHKSIITRIVNRAKQGPIKFLALILKLFLKKIISLLEIKRTKRDFPKYYVNYEIKNLDQFKIIAVEGKWSNSSLFLEMTSNDISLISECKLDCIIRCGSGILRGSILDITKFGVISFHHGDNRINRGGPSGFWEVLNGEPSSGFVIQKLNQELDGGLVFVRGNVVTKARWLTNNAQLLEKSNFFMIKFLHSLAINQRLPSPEGVRLHANKLYKLDSNFLLIKYLWKIHLPAKVSGLVSRLISPLDTRWSIAYAYHNNFSKSLWRYKEIENPKGRFLADPFVIENDNQTFIFVEDLFLNDNKGRISAIKVKKHDYEFLGVVLEEDFHLSFPFIFKEGDSIYMVPESCENNDIRLYKSKNFPFEWEYEKTLMDNVDAADTMLFKIEGTWFMLTNICSARIGEHASELHIFYSNNFKSDKWIPISEGNPVIFDSQRGRNGGFFVHNSKVYRVNQSHDQSHYGKSFRVNEIITISKKEYVEKEVSIVESNFISSAISTHHFHANEKIAVFDFARRERLKKSLNS